MPSWEIVFGIIGTMGALVGIFYWIYTRNKDGRENQDGKKEQQATQQQAKEQFPAVCFHSFKLKEDQYDFIIGIPDGDYKNQVKLVTEFPIALINEGGSDLEDIAIIFKYVAHSPLPMPGEQPKMIPKNFMPATISHEHYKDEEQHCSAIKISNINPKTSVVAKEPINIFPTTMTMDIPLTTKDKVGVTAKVKMDAVAIFDIIIMVRNFPPKIIHVNLHAFISRNLDDLVAISVTRMRARERNNPVNPKKYLLFCPDTRITDEDEAGKKMIRADFNPMNVRLLHYTSSREFVFIEKSEDREGLVSF